MRSLGRVVIEGARAIRRNLERRKDSRLVTAVLIGIAMPIAMVGACAEDRPRTPIVGGGTGEAGGPGIPDRCASPNEGCPCGNEGEKLECGHIREQFDDYVTCQMGTRTCADGAWSACTGDRVTVKSTGTPGLGSQGLGMAAVCPKTDAGGVDGGPAFDLCDPYCNVTSDTPTGWDAGPTFTDDGGLTLIGTVDAGVPCDTLAVVPRPSTVDTTNTVTVTAFDPLTTTPVAPVRFNVTVTGPTGCIPPPATFNATWTIDSVDSAQITGTNNTNGQLTVAVPVAGPIAVTIYALGTSASTSVNVKVNVVESPTGTTDPNEDATATQSGAFGTWDNPTSSATASSAVWLYPYADTYFPLALPPPTIQYWYNNNGGSGTSTSLQDRSVKVSLRYPVNTQSNPTLANYSDFNYSIVVRESNTVSQSAGMALDSRDPQVVIPQTAWQYFEQTARGQNADILIQRRRGTTMETESRRRIHFVDGQLKGTVYYNSYSSQLSTYNTGAVLKINPGATQPTLAVQPSGQCVVCHTVNLDGTRLIANGSTNATFNSSRLYDMTSTTLPSPTVLDTYNKSTFGDSSNVPGDRYTFGGAWKDGSLYMTHGGVAAGDPNWRAPPDYSDVFKPTDENNAVTVTGWQTNQMIAVTPKFSPDGTKLAFGYWGGPTLPCTPTTTTSTFCSGSPKVMSPDTTGKRLTVMDFTVGCTTPPCTGASAGLSISMANPRNLTPDVASGINATTGTLKVGWPSFTPAGNAVVYQRQYRSSKALLTGWSPSDINTVAGALAELWLSTVPTNQAAASDTSVSPTRLLLLNGLNPSGTTSYLPEDNQKITAPATLYHRSAGATGLTFTINQADSCGVSASATNVFDYKLNYLPAVSPVQVGGMNWVVFTSRRMYGNIAYDDPWDAEPGPKGCGGSPCSCTSGRPPAKKLWVSAIDNTITGGSDPSHPAFYLPGQELKAGNSDGYWVSSPCSGLDAACVTNDDCCLATGASPTRECRVTSTATVPPTKQCKAISACSMNGGACAANGDCCAGMQCSMAGFCYVPPTPPVTTFANATTSREYIASCPHGTQVRWRVFEWQATVPTNTSIEFAVQSKANAAATYQPAVPLLMAIATPASGTGPGTWYRGGQTADEILATATNPPVPSGDYLKVTITFKPNTQIPPVLHEWRQIFDCVPAE